MGTTILTPGHIAFILIVALILFGSKRLPEVGRGLGTSMREFKDAVTGSKAETEAEPALAPELSRQIDPPGASAGHSRSREAPPLS